MLIKTSVTFGNVKQRHQRLMKPTIFNIFFFSFRVPQGHRRTVDIMEMYQNENSSVKMAGSRKPLRKPVV